MTESEAKAAFRALAKQTLEMICATGEGLGPYHRGEADYYSERCKSFTELSSFSAAVTALAAVLFVKEGCRPEDLNRLSLQFIYVLCNKLHEPVFDANVFDTVWASFWVEVLQTEWIDIGVAHLQNFKTTASVLDLGDGVSIRLRTPEALGSFLGSADWRVAHLDEDGKQGARGTHALVVVSKTPKTAANFNSVGDPSLQTRGRRALLALRLFKPGDARIGRMFLCRQLTFDAGVRAVHAVGFSLWHPGLIFNLEASEVASVVSMYKLLAGFEARPGEKLRNIALALRSFTSIYERIWPQAEDRIVDAVIALEALWVRRPRLPLSWHFEPRGSSLATTMSGSPSIIV
jgi:hypothetical protein